ncbi:hypothetical protein VTN77DRAFT_5699 [Rasamsonia byssochlamydoides]|uniref:uncharacterized protein n=1 Tax=Rasamsonia byssochlamydoides TaxID=89139 RepID=UPI003741FDF7
MSQLDLQDIIKVYPNLEHHCAGSAPSKGRRCSYSTNAGNRARACALLAKGTKKLQAGQPVDALLKELAPLVLCLRYHQYQAPDLVARWKEDIHNFRQSQQAQSRRQMSGQNGSPNSEDLAGLQEQYEVLAERVSSALDNLHRIHDRLLIQESVVRSSRVGYYSRLETRLDRTRELNLDQWMTRVTASARRLHRIIDDERPLSSSPRLSTTRTESTQEQDREEPHQTAAEIDPERREDRSRSSLSPRSSTSSTRTGTSLAAETDPPTRATTSTTIVRRAVLRTSHSSSRINTVTARPRKAISRRPIEKDHDCGICLNALLDNPNNSDSDDQNNASSSENEEQEAVDLVWCKARCGNNFHSECLHQWIDSCNGSGQVPTCPTCRTCWMD